MLQARVLLVLLVLLLWCLWHHVCVALLHRGKP
jgi:hypothetical protein